MPKLRHYDNLNTARFVTFCCFRRYKLLRTPRVVNVFLESVAWIRERHEIKLLGYVVMPEHVHLVLHPPDSVKLGAVIGELKARSAGRIITARMLRLPQNCRVVRNGIERVAFWQPRCYDHNCRSPETVVEKINYCHNNPVSRGLVSEPGDWPWSSYNWYTGQADVPLEMDEIEGGVRI